MFEEITDGSFTSAQKGESSKYIDYFRRPIILLRTHIKLPIVKETFLRLDFSILPTRVQLIEAPFYLRLRRD